MKDFDTETFQTKFAIADTAVGIYEEHRESFTLKQVATKLEINVADIFEYFPNKQAILLYYYESLVYRYRLMLRDIEDFDDYLLAEKLSNFVFTTFDMLSEHEAFVRKTFRPLVVCSYTTTEFEKQTEQLLNEFFTGDSRISMSSGLFLNAYFFKLIRKKYIALVRFWLRDESEDKEVSMELTDKYTAFIQEVMYNAAIDKGFDLAKFFYTNTNTIIGDSFRSIRNLFPEIEIRD